MHLNYNIYGKKNNFATQEVYVWLHNVLHDVKKVHHLIKTRDIQLS